MSTDVTYRWLDFTSPMPEAERDWQRIEFVLESKGWMALNRNTSRVLLAESGGMLVGFFIFQLIPFLGPTWATPSARGQVGDEMAQQMYEFLLQSDARGWLASAESVHGERLCKMFGMLKVEHPMYVMVGTERKWTQ